MKGRHRKTAHLYVSSNDPDRWYSPPCAKCGYWAGAAHHLRRGMHRKGGPR
jgi:hypothetical protein